MLVLLKITAVFALIIILLAKKVNLGYALLSAALVLGLIFGAGIVPIAKTAWLTLIDLESIKLVLLLSLIMILEKMMSRKNLMSNMVAALKNAIGNYRLTALVMPALIGLLPSAGGAIFSAPMVNEVCHEVVISNEKKSFINYWYRHIWELVFPIYMALVIGAGILKVPVSDLIGRLWPYTLLIIVTGLPFTYMGMPAKKGEKPREIRRNLIEFLKNFSPILVILFLYFAFKVELTLAVVAAIVILSLVIKIKPLEYVDLVKKEFNYGIIITLLSVLFFKNMLVLTDVVHEIPRIFEAMGVPNLLVAALLPLVIGLLGGMDSVYVAITLPIVASLGGKLDMGLITVAFVCGKAGVMLSPLHLCLTLTVDYFKASFNKVLLRLIIAEAILIASVFAAYLFIY